MKYKEKGVLFRKNLLSEKNTDFQVLYIGNEFCERLLPEPTEVREILNWCKDKKVKPVLITPFLTNEGIKKTRDILDTINGNSSSFEIVINDWGLLEAINSCSAGLKIWIGRMITSRYRNVLIYNTFRYLSYLLFKERVRIPGLFFDFLESRNVTGIEFNSPYYLIYNYKECLKRKFKIAIHIPYMYLTATRYCSSLDGYSGYFRDSIISCKKECLEYSGILHHRNLLGTVLSKGNAYFKKVSPGPLKNSLIIDRVIFNDSIIPNALSAQLTTCYL